MNIQNTTKLNKKKKKNKFFVHFKKIQENKTPRSEVLDALYFYLCNGYSW